MESPFFALLEVRAHARGTSRASGGAVGSVCVEWFHCVEEHRKSAVRNSDVLCSWRCDATVTTGSCRAHSSDEGCSDKVKLHAMYSRALYRDMAVCMTHVHDAHYFYRFMMWCYDEGVFIHPSVRVRRCASAYRDHVFTVCEDCPALTPLVVVPEGLCIGFQDTNSLDASDRNALYDAEREKSFHAVNTGNSSDADVCQFFFSSLGMIVSDLLTAKNSPASDVRQPFAETLLKVRTSQNAPYLDDSVIFDSHHTCLADVLLQMIRNYVNGGPLVNKVARPELQWAVSVSLSHSTPLTIGSVDSIGIIPVVHLFPHGGARTNAYVVSRNTRQGAAEKMAAYFREVCHLDFRARHGGRLIYVVPDRALAAGEEICLQAMAPVCDRDSEADQMWRLSCGSAPESFRSSAEVRRSQVVLTQKLVDEGGQILNRKKAT